MGRTITTSSFTGDFTNLDTRFVLTAQFLHTSDPQFPQDYAPEPPLNQEYYDGVHMITRWLDGSTIYRYYLENADTSQANRIGSRLQAGLVQTIAYHMWTFEASYLNRNPRWVIPSLHHAPETSAAVIQAYGRMVLGNPTIQRYRLSCSIVPDQIGGNDVRLADNTYWHPTEFTESEGVTLSLALIGLRKDGDATLTKVMAIESDFIPKTATEIPIPKIVAAILADYQGEHWADAYQLCLVGNAGEVDTTPADGTDMKTFLKNIAKLTITAAITSWVSSSWGYLPVGVFSCYTVQWPTTSFQSGFFNSDPSGVAIPPIVV